MNMYPRRTLFTERLELGPPDESDFQRYFEIQSDPETNLFNPKGAMDLDTAKTRFEKFLKHWKDHGFASWAIREKNSPHVIGFGGLSYLDYGSVSRLNLGYRFEKQAWGKGYATELSRFAIDHGFSNLGFDEIFALVRPEHKVSINVLEKCEFKRFGVLDDVPNQQHSLVFSIRKNKSSGTHSSVMLLTIVARPRKEK